MDRFLTLLGLALRAGKAAVGEDPVYDAIARGKAKAVFLAADAAENTAHRLRNRGGDTPCYPLNCSKADLGRALGRQTCALVAVTDAGFTGRLIELLQPQQPHDGGVSI